MTRISGMKRGDFDGVKIAQAICNFTTKHQYSIKRKVYYRILEPNILCYSSCRNDEAIVFALDLYFFHRSFDVVFPAVQGG